MTVQPPVWTSYQQNCRLNCRRPMQEVQTLAVLAWGRKILKGTRDGLTYCRTWGHGYLEDHGTS